MNKNARYDWIDSLLLAGGMILAVTLAVTVKHFVPNEWLWSHRPAAGGQFTFVLAVLPLVARRKIWGQPQLPMPKQGALWALASIVSLLITFAGVTSIAFGGFALSDYVEAKEDTAVQDTENAHVEIVGDGVDADTARRQAADLELMLIESRKEAQQDAHRAFESHRARAAETAALAIAVGALLAIVGASIERGRYPG